MTTATETISEVDRALKGKGEENTINEWNNDIHVTINDITQMTNFCMPTGGKNWPWPKKT